MLRLGILGAAQILDRALSPRARAQAGVELAAIASRDEGRAAAAAARLGISRVLPSYQAVVDDPDVDAVYVALPPALHAAWALRAADAGKHVWVEKPCCTRVEELDELACFARRIVLFEGLMVEHHPWQQAVAAIVREGELGPVRAIETKLVFSTPVPTSHRLLRELGGGIFWDAAPYWVQFAQVIAGAEPLQPGAARAGPGAPGEVDREFRAELVGPGWSASFEGAFGDTHRAEHVIRFARGSLRHAGFLRPAAGPVRVNLHLTPDGGATRIIGFEPAAYYEAQLCAFARACRDAPGTHDLGPLRRRTALLQELYRRGTGGAPEEPRA